jgi:AcrR family transcriptional regulator
MVLNSGSQGRRSKLTADRESEILGATLALLEDVGYQDLTMPAVADRARCSTATIYRQWGGKPRLVLAALHSRRMSPPPDVDTGSLRGDLIAMTLDLSEMADTEFALMTALALASMRDESLARMMREELSAPAESLLDTIIDRAVARGEIEVDSAIRRYCRHVMLSAATAPQFAEHIRPTREYLAGFIDIVLLPILTQRAHRDGPRLAD